MKVRAYQVEREVDAKNLVTLALVLLFTGMVSADEVRTYTVKPGDTLSEIAAVRNTLAGTSKLQQDYRPNTPSDRHRAPHTK